MKLILGVVGLALLLFVLWGCRSGASAEREPLSLAEGVDLERFMGKWYVHGYTPTRFDPDAYGATETYELSEKGVIETTYRFRKGGPEGPEKTMRPKARVVEGTGNALWKMRFFGVFNAPYCILFVDEDYQYTVIGHPNRELAWIMARDRILPLERYEQLLAELEGQGFERSLLQRIEHPAE